MTSDKKLNKESVSSDQFMAKALPEDKDNVALQERVDGLFAEKEAFTVTGDDLAGLRGEIDGLGENKSLENKWSVIRARMVEMALQEAYLKRGIYDLKGYDIDFEEGDKETNPHFKKVKEAIVGSKMESMSLDASYDQQGAYIKYVVSQFVEEFKEKGGFFTPSRVKKAEVQGKIDKLLEKVKPFEDWVLEQKKKGKEGEKGEEEAAEETKPADSGPIDEKIALKKQAIDEVEDKLKSKPNSKRDREAWFNEPEKTYPGLEGTVRSSLSEKVDEALGENKEIQATLGKIGWNEGGRFDAVKIAVSEWVFQLVSHSYSLFQLRATNGDASKMEQLKANIKENTDRFLRPKMELLVNNLLSIAEQYNLSFEEALREFSQKTEMGMMSGLKILPQNLAKFLSYKKEGILEKLSFYQEYKEAEAELVGLKRKKYCKSGAQFDAEVFIQQGGMEKFSIDVVSISGGIDLKTLVMEKLSDDLSAGNKEKVAAYLVDKIGVEIDKKGLEGRLDVTIEVKSDGSVEALDAASADAAQKAQNETDEKKEEGLGLADMKKFIDEMEDGTIKSILLFFFDLFEGILGAVEELTEKVDKLFNKEKYEKIFQKNLASLSEQLGGFRIKLPDEFVEDKRNKPVLEQIFKMRKNAYQDWESFVDSRLDAEEVGVIQQKIKDGELTGTYLKSVFRSEVGGVSATDDHEVEGFVETAGE